MRSERWFFSILKHFWIQIITEKYSFDFMKKILLELVLLLILKDSKASAFQLSTIFKAHLLVMKRRQYHYTEFICLRTAFLSLFLGTLRKLSHTEIQSSDFLKKKNLFMFEDVSALWSIWSLNVNDTISLYLYIETYFAIFIYHAYFVTIWINSLIITIHYIQM